MHYINVWFCPRLYIFIYIFINLYFFLDVEAFIKSNFSEMHNNLINKIIGIGSISDETYKIEVHVINFNDEDYSILDINKGDKVEITGYVRDKSTCLSVAIYTGCRNNI